MNDKAANSDDQAEAVPEAPQAESKVSYSMSSGLVGWIAANHTAIAVSSYQSGKFYLLGQNPQTKGLMIHERYYKRAMGIATPKPGTLLLATLFQIMRFENVLSPDQRINHLYDACFVPRNMHSIGNIDAHDVGLLANGEPVFVSTAYNCLATLSEKHSFKPYWRPPFISQLVKEDRCHLNGMAMGEAGTPMADRPAYVTACSRSDTIDGWRDRRSDGGVVIDVETGKIVATGLSMPHSPRLANGRLYVLNSGSGELGWIDRDTDPAEAFKPIAFCPGFVRGLAIHGKYALVGLSKPRYKRFEGLALDQRLADADSEPWCGVQIIDLESGSVAHWFRIDGAIGELYDVAAVPGASCPMALGLQSNDILDLITIEE